MFDVTGFEVGQVWSTRDPAMVAVVAAVSRRNGVETANFEYYQVEDTTFNSLYARREVRFNTKTGGYWPTTASHDDRSEKMMDLKECIELPKVDTPPPSIRNGQIWQCRDQQYIGLIVVNQFAGDSNEFESYIYNVSPEDRSSYDEDDDTDEDGEPVGRDDDELERLNKYGFEHEAVSHLKTRHRAGAYTMFDGRRVYYADLTILLYDPPQ